MTGKTQALRAIQPGPGHMLVTQGPGVGALRAAYRAQRGVKPDHELRTAFLALYVQRTNGERPPPLRVVPAWWTQGRREWRRQEIIACKRLRQGVPETDLLGPP